MDEHVFLTPFWLRPKRTAEVYPNARMTVRCAMRVNRMDVAPVTPWRRCRRAAKQKIIGKTKESEELCLPSKENLT